MPKQIQPLTDTEIKKAKSKNKVYALRDGDGLQLRIKPNGSKIWLLDYRRPYTRTRTSMSLGSYPTISLKEARQAREKAKKLLSKNTDPQEYRDTVQHQQNAAAMNTLEHVSEQWLEVKKAKISADHANDTWRSLELHILPRLGKVPIDKITAPKIIETIKPIANKGNLETVKRLCQRLNEIMTYAVNTGLIDHNKLSGINQAFQSPQKTHLPTIKPEQLPELMRAIASASIRTTTRCVIEWQLHTMVRPNEAAGTRWDEINWEKKLWSIPAKRMKRKRDHHVPLSPQALNLLEAMKPISSHTKFVFPSDRKPKSHIHRQTANMALKRMGFANQLVAHGLRSLASTTLNEQGFDPDIIEAALSHVDKNEVRNAYNRADYINRRRPMMDWWSQHTEEAAQGNFSLGSQVNGLKLVSNR